MRVLITGGQGFLGIALTKELKKRGHYVASYDLKEGNAACVDYHIRGSILHAYSLNPEIEVLEPDVVVHAAALLGVSRTDKAPTETLNVILEGTRNVCEICAPKYVAESAGTDPEPKFPEDYTLVRKAPRLVYLSSSEIYGDPARGVHLSEDVAPSPLTAYAAAKLCGEHYVRAYAGKWSIVRPFNIYGAGQRSAFVVKAMMTAALAGEPIKVFGDGRQVRSFCYIDDFVQGLAQVVEGRADGYVVNLGKKDPVSMYELATAVQIVTETKSKIELVPYERSDRLAARDPGYRCPDITWAETYLGWSPDTPLGEGLKRMMEEMRK